jgi:hypothetical protein
MNHPLLAHTKRTSIAVTVVLALVVGGYLGWQHWQSQVRPEALAAFLDKTAGGGRVRFSVVRTGILRQDEADLEMTVAATARTIQPLYSKIDTSDYLLRTFQLDSESIADARRMLADKGSSQNPAFTAAAPFPGDPYQATILQLKSPANTVFSFQGVIDAHRNGDRWAFTLVSGGFDGRSPQGDPRSVFGDATYVAGGADDDARLGSSVADLKAFAGRVTETRRNLELAHAATLDGRRKALLAQIAPGRVFRGLAVETGAQQGTPLYLEIAERSPENEVTALLRNDGSWRNARTFHGAWSADAEFENQILTLTSLPNEAVQNAGPFLENSQTWTFALHMDPQGGLSERNRLFQYQFQPLNQDQVSTLKVRLDGEFEGAFAATESGSLYHGTAVSRATGASEPILLRFTGRSEDGMSLEARIESATRSWKRLLHGAINANARRSGGEPVRLQSASSEAIDDAPPESVLGDRGGLEIHLGLKQGSLVGEDGHFTYRLSPAGEIDRHRLEADRAERARHFMAVFREGIVYDGTMREAQGFSSDARIEIAHVDRQTGAVAVRINSMVRLNVYRGFFGLCDPSGGTIALNATTQGTFDSPENFNIPFLRASGATTVRLTLTGSSIVGKIEGDPHWTMEFSAGTFLSAPTESSEPNSPPADGSVFPSFPKNGGAYLLSRGSWAPLSRNNGHVVVETVRLPESFEIPPNVVEALSEGIAQPAWENGKLKITYLQFDGKDPRPASNAPAMVLLFVDPTSSDSSQVELAPAETLKDGQRRVVIVSGSPTKIRFGKRRLAAYVRHVAPGFTLLTTTSALPPGPYVFNADAGYELIQE